MLPGNRTLVDNLIPILLHKPCCLKLPLPRTPRYCQRRSILVSSQPALSLWCLAPAVTHEKHCVSSTSLAV